MKVLNYDGEFLKVSRAVFPLFLTVGIRIHNTGSEDIGQPENWIVCWFGNILFFIGSCGPS